jgi:putative DNA primase/helicase
MDERQEYDQQNHAALGMNYADTEVGNRDRFVDRNKDSCLYIPETNSWVQWDGVIWKKVPQANIMKLADETVKSISYEARTCDHPEGVSRLATWAIKSQTKAKLEAMVSLAKYWPDLTASVREFDDNPNIINCQNGVVDLRTKELNEDH